MEEINNENGIKTILLGESGVGKTNLINVALGMNFDKNSSVTYCISFLKKVIKINSKEYILHIWDTVGQEKYRPLTKLFFKDSKIVILVYDKSLQESFKELEYWYNEVHNLLGDDIILAVCGNKDDLDDTDKDVNEDEAREFAKRINAKFKMTSAKENGLGFFNFLKELLEDYIKKNNIENIEKENQKKNLNFKSQRKKKWC